MGKKDLLKSTTKNKKEQKKKTAAPKKTAAKQAAPAKGTVEKKASPENLTGTALLLQQFDAWKPAKLFAVTPDKENEKRYTSPPFYPEKSKTEIDEIQKLLALKFDIQEILKKGEKAAAEKAAAEKAAAEKAAAEKAAAEKAAAEKAAAEKAAAEKAAAEKAAAEKAAAEKAAAEKAAAEKAAAEKAAAEKAAAEKAATEKAAAEKAAAEKAVAEKAAAEKAAAEKAAAEKAAAEKAAAEKTAAAKAAAAKAATVEKIAAAPVIEAPAIVHAEMKPEPDPLKKILTVIAAFLVIVFIPIIIASFLNTTNYYLKATDGALELWQGDFAPLGKNIVLSMPGAVPPETIEEVYCKKDVFPIVAGYLLDKADTLIEMEGLPDFQHIQSTLQEARAYAIEKPMSAQIDNRMTKIEFMNLLYKADVELNSSSVDGKAAAIAYLEKAALLDLDVHEAEMVARKIKTLQPEK